ncbi:uncharacterized protein LOC111272172 isoform X10 [Varroa jacobsoni]|uniref:uncharacterized protein LOC111272172 isoform X10 n=1 Tax=Varroa jacobsoni TaxID=62625 RepID=UPI000BFAA921|nr:uncharacterized protein LOC111272172 isoform X10 [Varroa jacobsoni]
MIDCLRMEEGLITGCLTSRFGPRCIALIGSAISCAAITACYFADDVNKFTIVCQVLHVVPKRRLLANHFHALQRIYHKYVLEGLTESRQWRRNADHQWGPRRDSIKSVSVSTETTAVYSGGLSSSRRESISSNHRLRLRQNASAISVPISLFAPAISMECAPEQDFEINEDYESSHATAAGPSLGRICFGHGHRVSSGRHRMRFHYVWSLLIDCGICHRVRKLFGFHDIYIIVSVHILCTKKRLCCIRRWLSWPHYFRYTVFARKARVYERSLLFVASSQAEMFRREEVLVEHGAPRSI